MSNALTELVFHLDGHPDTAVVSGRLLYPDLSDQGVARRFPSPVNAIFGRTTLLSRLFPRNRHSADYMVSRGNNGDTPFEVDWVSGACLMIRKRVLDRIGWLDERFFMYWEDADICRRVKNSGGRVFCIPAANVIHHEGKSSRHGKRARLVVSFHRSAYHYYRKHHLTNASALMQVVAIYGLGIRALALLCLNTFASGKRPASPEKKKCRAKSY